MTNIIRAITVSDFQANNLLATTGESRRNEVVFNIDIEFCASSHFEKKVKDVQPVQYILTQFCPFHSFYLQLLHIYFFQPQELTKPKRRYRKPLKMTILVIWQGIGHQNVWKRETKKHIKLIFHESLFRTSIKISFPALRWALGSCRFKIACG